MHAFTFTTSSTRKSLMVTNYKQNKIFNFHRKSPFEDNSSKATIPIFLSIEPCVNYYEHFKKSVKSAQPFSQVMRLPQRTAYVRFYYKDSILICFFYVYVTSRPGKRLDFWIFYVSVI